MILRFLLILTSTSLFSLEFYYAGVPKCGTHLLIKTLYYLNGESFSHAHPFLHPDNYERDLDFITSNPQTRFVLIIRDPRDALLSAYEYIGQGPFTHPPNTWDYWHLPLCHNPAYEHMSDNERIAHMIKLDSENLLTGSQHIHTGFRVALAVEHLPNVKIIRFEDLVGSQGGGDDNKKARVLFELCHFLHLPKKNMDRAYLDAWGPENQHAYQTFRHGAIGRWRSHFDAHVIDTLKTHAQWNEFITHFGYEPTPDW